jgi:hypothetical protein
MARLPRKHAKDNRTFKNRVFTLSGGQNSWVLAYVSAVVRFQPFIVVSFNFHLATMIGI